MTEKRLSFCERVSQKYRIMLLPMRCYSWSPPARHNWLCSRWQCCVCPIRVRLPHNLFTTHPSHQYTVALVKNEQERTNGAISFLADEHVLKCSIWWQVHRRHPHRVISRIKRYLHVCVTLSVNQDDHNEKTNHIGGIPVSKLWHTSHDKNILLRQDEQWCAKATPERNSHLAKCSRRILVEQHRDLLHQPRIALPSPLCARVYCDHLMSVDGDCQATIIPDCETEPHKSETLGGCWVSVAVAGLSTYAVLVHHPATDTPSTTLQYDPAGRPVMNDIFQSLSALLIATKPREPVHSAWVPSVQLTKREVAYTVRKGYLLGWRRDPAIERSAANLIPESDHARGHQ